MKKWIQKAIVQKTISYMPFSHKINYIFQKYVTKGVYLSDEYFFDRLIHAREHIRYYQKISGKNFPNISLEIGTGWYPIILISLFLIGAECIYSVDIVMLTSKNRIRTTLEKFMESYHSSLLQNYFNFLPERMKVLKEILNNFNELSMEDIFNKLNIRYLIEDARKLSLKDNSVNLVTSNNTFEHIYPTILIPILSELRRVVNKKEGVMSHFIDMSDHFAHFDKSINIYNFLKFSDKKWKWIDNSIQPQSRIRIYDYKKIFLDLSIPITEEIFIEGNLDDLKTITLSEKFLNFPLKEIAKSQCHFISDMKNM